MQCGHPVAGAWADQWTLQMTGGKRTDESLCFEGQFHKPVCLWALTCTWGCGCFRQDEVAGMDAGASARTWAPRYPGAEFSGMEPIDTQCFLHLTILCIPDEVVELLLARMVAMLLLNPILGLIGALIILARLTRGGLCCAHRMKSRSRCWRVCTWAPRCRCFRCSA